MSNLSESPANSPMSNHTMTYIGGIAFLLANMPVYLPYTILYCIAALFGVLGNVCEC
jgi:hypothetical protein